MAQVPTAEERTAEVAELGEKHAGLRLCDEESVRRMRDSLARTGQLVAVAVYRPAGADNLEVVDGFKRLRAARELGWTLIRVRVLVVDDVQAKVTMGILNHGRGLSELEEAWLCRSLYRDDGLTQPQIGRLLGRHKSWVSRRLLLAEGLDEAVQADVRLGLLSATSATYLARLPRCNQRAAADLVMRRGMTRHQTDRLCTELLAMVPAERAAALERAGLELALQPGSGSGRTRRPERTAAQSIIEDVAAVTRLGARLQARLLDGSLSACPEAAAHLVRQGLDGVRPVLASLIRTIEQSLEGAAHAAMEDA